MDDLIKALQILRKYGNSKYPTGCVHDVMLVFISPSEVSAEDKATLHGLGFIEADPEYEEYEDCFFSFRFGSA